MNNDLYIKVGGSDVEVNGNTFGTVSSGGTIDIPVVNGGSNPVGTIDGGQVIIGDSSVFINGTQVGDVVAEDTLSIAVELDGVPAGTWNAGAQTWEIDSTPIDEWVRPSDWLPIPNIVTGEQVFYGLCMVHQDRANLVSLRFTGNYTVDWGDGVVENFASNVVAHHQYSWSSVGNVTSEGFRQALIKVTPQAGQNLTGINLQFKHPLMGGGNLKNSIFIDMVMNLPQLASGASIVLGGTVSIRHAFVERLNIMSIGSATSLSSLCQLFFKLQKFQIGDTSNVTIMQSMFYNCYNLTTVPLFNTANVTNMNSMFFNCVTLTILPLFNTANVTNMANMFQNCQVLKSVTLNLSSVSSVLASTFALTVNIETLILSGCRYGFNIANNEMSASALNALFTSLGTAVGSQTITITGNPGASTCDTTIATSKGFTVVI